ncbi:MAG: TonB-dependent receptor [Blastocatellia bacterium]|nr:TonB-dependent receptor [Blastocatellia bacterium]
MIKKRFIFCLKLLLAIFLCFGDTIAQSSVASLSGIVVDESGANISGASITITNIDTQINRQVMSNGDGLFTFPLLSPGKYILKVSSNGFSTTELRDLTLNVSDQRSIKVEMKLGTVSEVVTVVSNSSIIDESPAISTVVDRQFIENQPLNGRSFQTLIELSPGVNLTSSDVTSGGQFSVNGQRPSTNYFTIDGVSANFGTSVASSLYQSSGGGLPSYSALGSTNTLASVDAVQEFAIQTSTYAPEFGRQPGAQLSIVTRSGTNSFHGTVFNYLRNDIFDANDFFANAGGLPKPALRQNDFGGVLGGPVLLPGYDGRNRTFFFFSYEGLRLRQPLTSSPITVPSLAARQAAPANVREILNAFPLPNGTILANDPNTATFVSSFSNPSTIDATSVRIDHTFNSKFSLFGRYNYAPSEVRERAFFATPNTIGLLPSRTETLTLGATYSFSPTLTNDFRFNYSRAKAANRNILDGFGGASVPSDSIFFPSFASSQTGLGIIAVGNSVINVGINSNNKQTQFNFVNNLSLTAGSHSLKFGVDYRRLSSVNQGADYLRGLFFDSVNDVIAGNVGFAVLLSVDTFLRPIYNNFSAFAQDTWKINNRLTLTYGLRYEVNPAPTEKNGNLPFTVTGIDSATGPVIAPRGTRYYDTTYGNFAPRIGIAYQLFPKLGTVVRAGTGIFYDLGYTFTGNAISSGTFPYGNRIFAAGLSLNDPLLSNPIPSSGLEPPFGYLLGYEPGYKLPYTLQYNLTVEQPVGTNASMTASYVAAIGRRLGRVETLSAPTPEFTQLDLVRNASTSDYHSLQLQYQRRLSNGLQALVSYTFAKSLDTSSDETQTNYQAPLAVYDVRLDRGPSSFDVRHAFTAAISYNIPSLFREGVGRMLLSNFSVDTIVRARSATPVNILSGQDPFGIGATSVARPDLVAGQPLYIDDPGVAGRRRINQAAFTEAPAGQQGNLGRNALRGFAASQIDIALRRQFRLTETTSLQLRLDAFNLFNNPNFANPSGNLTDVNFGISTQSLGRGLAGLSSLYQIGGPRSLQLALKVIF